MPPLGYMYEALSQAASQRGSPVSPVFHMDARSAALAAGVSHALRSLKSRSCGGEDGWERRRRRGQSLNCVYGRQNDSGVHTACARCVTYPAFDGYAIISGTEVIYKLTRA